MRIEGDGGKVINWNGARVFGVLAMSRAIGIYLFSSFQMCCFSISKLAYNNNGSNIKASNDTRPSKITHSLQFS